MSLCPSYSSSEKEISTLWKFIFILYFIPIWDWLWFSPGLSTVRLKPTENGMYIHPATKQPFDGVYDVVENGERLKMEIKVGGQQAFGKDGIL